MLKLDNNRKTLYQWDVGVVGTLTIDGVDEVHFSNLRYGVSFNIKVVDNKVEFPPEVLQSGADVFCWAFVREENGGYTKKEQTFNVEKRPRPADYVYEPTEVLNWETLKKEIEKLDENTKKEIEKLDENTDKALADLEKGTIKTVSDVNLWELETGIYYVSGGYSDSPSSWYNLGDEKHIFVIYKMRTDYVKYIHFCGNIYGTNWMPIDCGISSGVLGKSTEYKLTDTSMLVNIIDKNSSDNKFPSAKSVYIFGDDIKKELQTEISTLKTELQGDIEDISALVGGAE